MKIEVEGRMIEVEERITPGCVLSNPDWQWKLAEETFQREKQNCGEPIISRWSNWHDGIYPAYGNEELKKD